MRRILLAPDGLVAPYPRALVHHLLKPTTLPDPGVVSGIHFSLNVGLINGTGPFATPEPHRVRVLSSRLFCA